MEIKVKKRDGKVVNYNPKKIETAVYKAAKAITEDKDYSLHLSKKIANKVDIIINNIYIYNLNEIPGEIITVEQIQDCVEKELMSSDKEVAKGYIIYRFQHEKIRGNKSNYQAAMDIISDYINRDDWEVNENSNMSFSLQGLNNRISSEITSHYWVKEIYPPNIMEVHESGDLHIHDLSNLSVYCCGWDIEDLLISGFGGVSHKVESKPPKHFGTALMQAVNFLYTLQGEASGAQAFSSFDTYLAPFIAYDNLDYEQVKQRMQEFIYNINVPTRVGFQTPFSNITMDLTVPEHLKDQPVIIGGQPQERTYREFQNEMDLLNKAFAEIMLESDSKGRVFSFPIPTYNITADFNWDNPVLEPIWEMTAKYGIPYFANFVNSDMKPDDVRSMCCRLRISNKELRKRGGGLFGANPMTGSIGVVTINMARIGHLAETKEEYKERLLYLMDIAKESLLIKRKVLENLMDKNLYPYSKYYLRSVNQRFGSYWQNHFNTIGINGMNESMLNFMGKTTADPEAIEFIVEIMEFMRDKMVEYQEETGTLFNLEATPAESTSYRLALKDKAKYGDDIFFANDDRVKTEDAEPYYTNSTHLPVSFTDDIFKALELQDETQSLYTGGTVLHGFVGERMPSAESTKKLVKVITDNFGLPYVSITPTFSICPIHGYLAGEHEFCPKCDAENAKDEQSA